MSIILGQEALNVYTRLLRAGDEGETTVLGYPLVGWKPIAGGEGMYNPRGFGAVRIVVGDRRKGDLYDQYSVPEDEGAAIVCYEPISDRVALIKQERAIGERLEVPDPNQGYLKQINEAQRWGELVASLGRRLWEVPRGILPRTTGQDLLKRALMEAFEETGLTLRATAKVWPFNADTTFFPHWQFVVKAEIVSVGRARPEDLEIIGEMRLFTRQELRELADAGELVDGWVAGALQLAGFHF